MNIRQRLDRLERGEDERLRRALDRQIETELARLGPAAAKACEESVRAELIRGLAADVEGQAP